MNINKNHEPSYEGDYFGWICHQAEFLKNKQYEKLDMDNLIEEIESLGRSEKNALKTQLRRLFLHLLKKKYQPGKNGRSWELSIKNAKQEIHDTLKDNPSLKSKLNTIAESAYRLARIDAADQTDIAESVFPVECPWNIEDILKEEK